MREKILTFIEKNSRIDLNELAIILGVDEATVMNELESMEKEGIICGYHTLINWDKAGVEKVSALIEVRVTPQRGMGFDKVAERIYNYPEVNSVYLISGGFDLMVTLEGKTLREISQFVSDKLSALDQVLSTKTNFILKKYKDHGTVMAAKPKDERIMLKNYDGIMRDPLSKTIKTIQPSGIRKFFDIVSEMDDAISLGVGEPDFDTPWHIRDEGIYSLEKGRTFYTSNAGLKELKIEIAKFLSRRYGLTYDYNKEMLVTIGGSEAIDIAMRAMLDPGDEVIIPQPSYVSYLPCAVLANGTPVIIDLKAENEFRLTAEELEAAITPKTKILVLPFPNNPTGAVMEKKDLEAIAEVIIKHDIFVISDEIYSELTYLEKHVSIASLPGMKERTIVINGFSKSHAMTGWRLGYACGPAEIIKQMIKIHQFAIMCAPTTSQYAAVEAMRNGDEDVQMMREEYNGRRRYLMQRFKDMGLSCFEPFGAFYVFPCIKEFGMTSDEFANKLLQSKKVAVVPGTAFGASGEGFIRISYAYSLEDLKLALSRVEEFINELRAAK